MSSRRENHGAGARGRDSRRGGGRTGDRGSARGNFRNTEAVREKSFNDVPNNEKGIETAKSLKTDKALETVQFRDRTAEVANQIFNSISFNRVLVSLDVSNSKFDTEAVKTLGSAISANKTLRKLVLFRCDFKTAASIEPLASALSRNTTLSNLNMRNTFGVNFSAIAKALESNQGVKIFNFGIHAMDDGDVRALGQLLLKNRHLRKINLEYAFPSSWNVNDIEEGLIYNTTLEKLDLSLAYQEKLPLAKIMVRSEVGGEDRVKIVLQNVFGEEERICREVVEFWRKSYSAGQKLITIPKELFLQGYYGVKTYLKAVDESGLSEQKRIKLLMVGKARAGKTSLINTLMTQKSGLTVDGDDRATISVEIRPWAVNDCLCSVWDFGGQDEYFMTHSFFFSRRSIAMLVVNLSNYNNFEKDVNEWIRMIQMHVPGFKFLLVGTHCDEVSSEDRVRICESIYSDYLKTEEKNIGLLKKQINSAPPNKVKLQEQLENRPTCIGDRVFAVSSSKMDGIQDLYDMFISYVDKDGVAIRLPSRYSSLMETLATYGRAQPNEPVLELSSLNPAQMTFVGEEELHAALELLHLIGFILWYRHDEVLVNRIFCSPRWVVDLSKSLIRHDMFVTETGHAGVLHNLIKPQAIPIQAWSKIIQQVERQAILDTRLLPLLDVWKDVPEDHYPNLLKLLEQFELLMVIPQKGQSNKEMVLVPFFLKGSKATKGARLSWRKSIADVIGSFKSNSNSANVAPSVNYRVFWRYCFTDHLPPGLFLRLCVRAYRLGTLDAISVSTMYQKVGKKGKIILREDISKRTISVYATHEDSLDETWRVFIPFAREMENLVKKFSGITYHCEAISTAGATLPLKTIEPGTHPDLKPVDAFMEVIYGHKTMYKVEKEMAVASLETQLQNDTLQNKDYLNIIVRLMAVLETILEDMCKKNDIALESQSSIRFYTEKLESHLTIDQFHQMTKLLAHQDELFPPDMLGNDSVLILNDNSVSEEQNEIKELVSAKFDFVSASNFGAMIIARIQHFLDTIN